MISVRLHNMTSVSPTEFTETKVITSFDVLITSLKLNEGVHIRSRAYSFEMEIIFEKLFFINGEEYENWGTDDMYIIRLIASKLGLTIQ